MICKCGATMLTKQGNISIPLGFIWGETTYCPNCPDLKWWQLSGHSEHTQRTTHPIDPPIAAERVERMRHLSSIGVTYEELGKIFGISWQSAREICLRNGK